MGADGTEESTLGRHHREGDGPSGEGTRDSLGGEVGGRHPPEAAWSVSSYSVLEFVLTG